MTGDKRYLPLPPAFQFHMNLNSWDWHCAAVCAAGHADHGDCRSCPFLVAFLFTHNDKNMASACIYSSKTGIWSEVTSVAIPLETTLDSRATLIGNTLYWLSSDSSIFELDLDKHSLGVIEDVLPYSYGIHYSYDVQIIIMPAQDGQLGFARVDGFSLHLWSRAAASIDGVVTWTCRRVIDLEKFLAPEVLAGYVQQLGILGFAEDADVLFINVDSSIYMIKLKSMEIEKVLEVRGYCGVLPYTSFYTPAIAIGGGDDQAELLDGG